ncbi:VOC family protein [Cryptosporangium minutisporangium]|uniref:VOC family protein n=1 Tax=Cryptosporangium minutisporangium TaxID=113569 RepID=A0ABP6STZ3_9ACTN
MSSAPPAPERTAPLTGLTTGHVGLNVTDLVRSRNFYADVLGLDVLGTSTDPGREYAFLGVDGALVLTLWQQSDGRFDPRRPGLHHLSFQVADAAAVATAEARVRACGAEFVHDGVVAHGEGARSGGIFFLDPDGTRLEVFAPTGAENAPAPTEDAPTCGFF